jgi:hypothetical protein
MQCNLNSNVGHTSSDMLSIRKVCSMAKIHESILRMALVGYEAERQKVQQQITEIQRRLGGASKATGISGGAKPKRALSAAARRRIAAAQKKRWAAFHKRDGANATAVTEPKPKRKLSPARRAALIASLKKARAARAAKRAAA